MEWSEDFDLYYIHNGPLQCYTKATASAGDGLLYKAELFHRGRAHSDPNAPERVVVFLTFAESLVDADDTRMLPPGQSHVLRWNLWGHTIDEFTTIDKKKWRFWHSLGIFLPKQQSKDIYRPWNILDSPSLVFRDHGGERDELFSILYYIRDYFFTPTLQICLPEIKERPAEGVCGPSTEKLEDIQIDGSSSMEQAVELMKEHGAGIVQSVLTKETADDLRNFVLKENNQSVAYVVHSPANRYYIAPDVKTPIVQQALKEIAEHPVMRPLIDDLLGPAASLTQFNVITNLYGALDQPWHSDIGPSARDYPDDFVREYTITIPLQDTTKEMGATGMC
jgi:hypothetical protein